MPVRRHDHQGVNVERTQSAPYGLPGLAGVSALEQSANLHAGPKRAGLGGVGNQSGDSRMDDSGTVLDHLDMGFRPGAATIAGAIEPCRTGSRQNNVWF